MNKHLKTKIFLFGRKALKIISYYDLFALMRRTFYGVALVLFTTSVLAASSNIIGKIQFSGNQKITNEALQSIPEIQSLIGQPINEKTKEKLSKAVRDFYIDHGFFLTQVWVSNDQPQSFQISIFEGKVDKILVKNTSHYADEHLLRYATKGLCDQMSTECTDIPIQQKNLERMIGVISDLPGISNVNAILSPGSRVGTSLIELSAKDGKRYSAYISADNYGNKVTGKNRATVGLIGHNWGEIGDQLVLELTTTDKSDNTIGQLGYSIPILYDGWRVGLNFSQSQYYLYEEFKAAQIKGKSDNYSLWASYPIIRSKNHNLSTRLSYDNSNPKDSILTVEQPWRTIHGLSASLNGQIVDHLWRGRSFSSYGMTLQQNSIKADDDNYQGTTGSFSRLLWNASRDQELFRTSEGDRLSAYISLRGQEANKTMDASMRYSLGGPSGVRAYPGGEAPGDRAALGTLEFRYGIPLKSFLKGFLTLALFHDHGWKKNAEVGIGNYGYGDKTIYGNGVSITLSVLDQWSIKAEWAHRGDSSDMAVTEENPNDSRFWLTGSVSF